VDIKVSRREQRFQPDGPVEVLLDNTCDLYPIFDEGDEDLIVDVEFLDDDQAELLDRAMFAAVKQRGLDPLDPDDGIQWAEYAIGDVVAPVILQQATTAVGKEGPGVRIALDTVRAGGVDYTTFTIKLSV
jgi:hypothetical protein